MVAVMDAPGHTGKAIAEALLTEKEPVRALGRDGAKLVPLAARGAEPQTGDAAFLARAFAGADAVYTLIPPDPTSNAFRAYQDGIGETIAQALREAGVSRVVFLFSLGADLPAGTGPIAGVHAQEERLRAIPVFNSIALRPSYFFENHFAVLPMIRHQGFTGGRGDLPFPQTATPTSPAPRPRRCGKRPAASRCASCSDRGTFR